MLKERYDLLVLKVELRDRAGTKSDGIDARFTLQGKVDGRLATLADLSQPGAVTGLTDLAATRNPNPVVGLSTDLLSQLGQAVAHFGDGQRPLWVHLVKPYGALRLLPWERLLVAVVNVPVLMLPDFIFPRPREATATLEVALCGSAPLGHESHGVRQALVMAVHAVLGGSARRTRVQLFTDANLAGEMRHIFQTQAAAGQVLVHDTQDAAPFVQEDTRSRLLDQAGVLRSPWLLWMRQALRERAVDVVHFCCHGRLTRGRGALLFAQSPLDRSDDYLAGPVGMTELQTLLTQVGAWSSAFTSLPDNFSEVGLRALADETAQNRPGPMLMHNMQLDPTGDALGRAYGFIYAAEPGPPPLSPALFLYCQPYLATASMPAAAPPPVVKPAAVRRRGRSRVEAASAGVDRQPGRSLFESPSAGVDRQPASSPSPPPPPPPPPPFTPRERGAAALPEVARNPMQARQAEAAALPSAVDALFAGQHNASPWVATTERFADSVQLRYQELARDELLPQELCLQHASVADDTLAQLRAAVAELAQRRGTV